MTAMANLLSGIRVLDFGRVIAAPRCARFLADLGADVIHIERPGQGDDTRCDPLVFEDGMSGAFMQENWGKKSLCIDLKHPQAKDVIYPLVKRSDVVIENFRPGVMKELGFGYPQLKRLNNQLVMCSISAYGQTGPYAKRSGYGFMADAMAGIPELAGDPIGPPTPTPIPLSDCAASMLAFALICAALHGRGLTKEGMFIDLSLLDAAFCLHDLAIQLYFSSKGTIRSTRRGMYDDLRVPWGYFEVGQEWICIMCGTDRQWTRLVQTMGRPEMANAYPSNSERVENRETIYQAINDWVKEIGSADQVLDILTNGEIPCARLNTIHQAINDKQVKTRNLFVECSHPSVGDVMVQNFLGKSFKGPDPDRPAPRLGQHSYEVIVNFAGLSEATYRDLVQCGCIYSTDSDIDRSPQEGTAR